MIFFSSSAGGCRLVSVGDIAVGDFAGYMKNLRLAHPKLLDVAVPANLRCGRPENETALATADPSWAQLHYSFAGVWEINPHDLEEHAPEVQILDVREPDEFTGPLYWRLLPVGCYC